MLVGDLESVRKSTGLDRTQHLVELETIVNRCR